MGRFLIDIPVTVSDVPPEGNISAPPNTQINYDGEVWIKRAGTDSTGWVKYSIGSGGSTTIVDETTVDLNTSGDQALTVIPAKYRITKVVFSEPSTSLVGSIIYRGGIFTDTGGGGENVITGVPKTLLTATSAIANASIHSDIANTLLTESTLYYRNTGLFGSSGTVKITIFGESY